MQVRDMKLLEGIEKHRYLRVDQAAQLFFPTIKNFEQQKGKARERLLVLYRNKLASRARYPNEPYIYFARGNTRNHKMNHYLMITEVLLQIKKQFPAGSHIEYEIESKQRHIVPDLIIHYKNDFRNEKQTYYVEVELDSSADIEGKIRAYEELLDKEKLIVVCKHKRSLEQARAVDTDLNIIVTDLANINIGNRSFI